MGSRKAGGEPGEAAGSEAGRAAADAVEIGDLDGPSDAADDVVGGTAPTAVTVLSTPTKKIDDTQESITQNSK